MESTDPTGSSDPTMPSDIRPQPQERLMLAAATQETFSVTCSNGLKSQRGRFREIFASTIPSPEVAIDNQTFPTSNTNAHQSDLEVVATDPQPSPAIEKAPNFGSDAADTRKGHGFQSFFSGSSQTSIRPKIFRTSRTWLSRKFSWRPIKPSASTNDRGENRKRSDSQDRKSMSHPSPVQCASNTPVNPTVRNEPQKSKRLLSMSRLARIPLLHRQKEKRSFAVLSKVDNGFVASRPERPPSQLCPDPPSNSSDGEPVTRYVCSGALGRPLESPDTVDTMTLLRSRFDIPILNLGTWSQQRRQDTNETQVQSPNSEKKSFISSLDLARISSDADCSMGRPSSHDQYQRPTLPSPSLPIEISPSPLQIQKVRQENHTRRSPIRTDRRMRIDYTADRDSGHARLGQVPERKPSVDLLPPVPLMIQHNSLSSSATSISHTSNRIFTASSYQAELDTMSTYTDISVADSASDKGNHTVSAEDRAMNATDTAMRELLALMDDMTDTSSSSDAGGRRHEESGCSTEVQCRDVSTSLPQHIPEPIIGDMADVRPRRSMIPKPIHRRLTTGSFLAIGAIVVGHGRKYTGRRSKPTGYSDQSDSQCDVSVTGDCCVRCSGSTSNLTKSSYIRFNVQAGRQVDAQTQTEFVSRNTYARTPAANINRRARSNKLPTSELTESMHESPTAYSPRSSWAESQESLLVVPFTEQLTRRAGHSNVLPSMIPACRRCSRTRSSDKKIDSTLVTRSVQLPNTAQAFAPETNGASDNKTVIDVVPNRPEELIGNARSDREGMEIDSLPENDGQARPKQISHQPMTISPGAWLKGTSIKDDGPTTGYKIYRSEKEEHKKAVDDFNGEHETEADMESKF